MSNGVNKVILIGNLGADPELRETNNGTAVANFRMATSRRFTQNGERREQTEWHRIVVWGKLAEHCKKYLTKGRQAYVEGYLQTRQWVDRDGKTRYTTEVVAREITFLGGGRRLEGDVSNSANEVPSAEVADPTVSQEAQQLGLTSDDDVPF